MTEDDLRTVSLADDIPDGLEEKAPILPSELAGEHEPVAIRGDVMGAVEVQDASKYGGTWGLRLTADFPVSAMDVVEVTERLTEGTYVLLRLGEE